MTGFRKAFGIILLSVLGVSSAVAAPTVTVVEKGAGTRAPLQFSVATGASQTLDVAWDMSLTTNMGTLEIPMELPTIQMNFGSKATASSASEIQYTLNLSTLNVAQKEDANPMVAQMQADMEKLVGMTTQSSVSRSGRVLSTKITNPGGASDDIANELTSALSQSLVVFPEEPVGVGAKWTVTDEVEERGLKLKRTTTVELKERVGDRVRLAIGIKAESLSNTVNAPGLPPGAKATLKSFDMSGSGMVLYQLNHLFPVESDVKINANTVMEVSAEGQSMEVGNGLNFKVTIRSE